MKIGIVCPYSFDVPGGVQFHVRDLAEYLLGQGHEVSVLAPADGDTAVPHYVVSCGRAVAVPYNGSIARLTFGPVTTAKVNRWLETGDFDLVHLHEPMTPSASLLALWAATVPVVATFHTANLRSRAMHAAYPLLRPTLEKITARIAVSDQARRTVISHIAGDAVVIPNGIDLAAFDVDPDPAWQGSEAAPVVAFLGRVDEPRKGLSVLLEAAERMLAAYPGLRVLVAGPGDPPQDLPEVTAAATHFLGRVSDQEKAALLASASLYVAPQTGGESFGIVLVEAMAAGAPVVASDLPAFVDVLGDSGAGASFRTGDPDDLAATAVALLGDARSRARMSQNGRQRAARFDWSEVGARIVDVYATALAAAPGPDSPLRIRYGRGPRIGGQR